MHLAPRTLCTLALVAALAACNGSNADQTASTETPATAAAKDNKAAPTTDDSKAGGKTPAELPQGLMVSLAEFITVEEGGKKKRKPGPARLEIITRQGNTWKTEVIKDEDSNVFHKAFAYTPPGGEPGIVTLGAMDAYVKIWRKKGGAWKSETLWTKQFGGKLNRMRDAEVADLYGDGKPDIAVATHDKGVVAVLRPQDGGKFEAVEIDKGTVGKEERVFVHEIEIGDVNGDKELEVYSTPSEPNRLDGSIQTGRVMRYVPKKGGAPEVAADLGDRHAKEILVTDMDGDGKDELYVAVEAKTKKEDGRTQLVEPVEIRRYTADTDPKKGDVIATLQDRLCRFLTAGDVDGDGKREMVVAPFKSGLYLYRPTPSGTWKELLVDKESSGFEHAAILLDLDGDKKDEIYVASDNQGELRRYTWNGSGFDKEIILTREDARAFITWNLMPVSLDLVK